MPITDAPARSDHYLDGAEPDVEAFAGALHEVLRVLEDAPVDCLVMGGVCSFALSRPRSTRDIDLFVRPADADRLLGALAAAGFETRHVDPEWLSKAWWNGVLVDVIFRSMGDIELDDEMVARAVSWRFRGAEARLLAPEDLAVVKAVTATEHGPHHWYDAVSLLRRPDLDWDYLVRRGLRHGPRRLLSLMLFAESGGVVIPDRATDALLEVVHPW